MSQEEEEEEKLMNDYVQRKGRERKGRVSCVCDREVGRGFNGAWSVCGRRGRVNGSKEGAKKCKDARPKE